MGDNFIYDAPQFIDFEEAEAIPAETLETYFNKDHEVATTYSTLYPQNEICDSPELESGKTDKDECSNKCDEDSDYSGSCLASNWQEVDTCKSPKVGDVEDISISDDFREEEDYLNKNGHSYKKIRKSLSMSCLPEDKPLTKSCVSNLKKEANMSTDRLNNLSQPKYGFSQNLKRGKFVSMAETAMNFQNQIPASFRSTKTAVSSHKVKGNTKSTVANSPMLLSRLRRRPVTVKSTEEKELLEYEEIKKNVFKAKPVSTKVLQGTKTVAIEKKPTTEVKPFKLTGVPKKVQKSPEALYEFHAKPISKQIYEPYKPQIKTKKTQPKTPTFMKKYSQEKPKLKVGQDEEEKKACKSIGIRQNTIPQPFSFEKRDQNLLARKEVMIQKAIEETKVSSEYHAKPVPKHVLRSPKIKPRVVQSQRGSKENLKQSTSEDVSTTFKARPPTVLQMKPFVPKKECPKVIKIEEFQLNTQKRAIEWDKFDNYLKEKEKIQAEEMQKLERQRALREEQEIARIRKEAVRAAEPIRRYKNVTAVTAKPLTEPHTPKLLLPMRIRNKENINLPD